MNTPTYTASLEELLADLTTRLTALRTLEHSAQDPSIARERCKHKADGVQIGVDLVQGLIKDLTTAPQSPPNAPLPPSTSPTTPETAEPTK